MNRKKISILVLSFFLTFFLAYSHQGITRESFAHIEEQFMPATALYELKDYHEAFALWLSLAEQGDAESSFRISEMYYRGEGVAADKINPQDKRMPCGLGTAMAGNSALFLTHYISGTNSTLRFF